MKLTINNVTLDTDTLTAEQREQIIAALADKPKGFRPKKGERYEYLHDCGWTWTTWNGDNVDLARLACGNVHPVGRGEYLHRRRIAVKSLWDYVESEMPFVPDWSNRGQPKMVPVYSRTKMKWETASVYGTQYQFEFPHVAQKDADRFLSDNADNLAVIAEGVDKWGM